MCIVDQQVHKIIPNTGGSFTFVESHDDNEDAVDGQLLGYSIDAVNDYAIVSDSVMTWFS